MWAAGAGSVGETGPPLADGRTKQQLWLAAAKPPMYSVAIAPVLTGAALAKQVGRARASPRGTAGAPRTEGAPPPLHLGPRRAANATPAPPAPQAHLSVFPWSGAWALTWPSLLVILWLNLRCGGSAPRLRAPPGPGHPLVPRRPPGTDPPHGPPAPPLPHPCPTPPRSNDAFDADTEVDKAKHESVVNLLGGRQGAVLAASGVVLAAGLWGLGATVVGTGGEVPLAMLGAAIACGYVYQGPPFRLSYRGLGEPLCFVSFGPLATVAFHLCLAGTGPVGLAGAGAALGALPWHVWGCASLVGLTTTAVLFCSHFHQVAGDLAAGKRSPVARLGTRVAAGVLAWGTAAFYVLLAAMVAAGGLPPRTLAICAASVPFAAKMVAHVMASHDRPEVVRTSKFLALRWHVVFFTTLCLSIAL